MESLTNSAPLKIAEEAKKINSDFSAESTKKLMLEVAVSNLPIPFIDIWWMKLMMRSEARQLAYVKKMEGLWKSSEIGKQKGE